MNTNKVVINYQTAKKLRKLPTHIIEKLQTWVMMVEIYGILEARKVKSYHDEPLKGERENQRSIRLNKAYRAFYVEKNNGDIELNYIEIIEVNKHEY